MLQTASCLALAALVAAVMRHAWRGGALHSLGGGRVTRGSNPLVFWVWMLSLAAALAGLLAAAWHSRPGAL